MRVEITCTDGIRGDSVGGVSAETTCRDGASGESVSWLDIHVHAEMLNVEIVLAGVTFVCVHR